MLGINTSAFIRAAGHYGVYAVVSELMRKQPRILMYHRFSEQEKSGFVSKAVFKKQLDYLLQHYNVMSLQQLSTMLYEQGEIPSNAIVITIDDGYKDFYEVAFPLLSERNLPATLFVTTGFIDGDIWLWPDKVRWLLEHNHNTKIDSPLYQCLRAINIDLDQHDIESCWHCITQYLLSVDENTKQAWIKSFAKASDAILPVDIPDNYAACSWTQLAEMQEQAIEIGGHSVTHPSLTKVTVADAVKEIQQSLLHINTYLGVRSRSFCYPNGSEQDVNSDIIKAVEAAGYACAVVAYHDHQMLYRRFLMRRHAGSADMFQFYKAVCGVESLADRMTA